MSTDTQLAELLGKNADLFAAYEQWANGQIMLLAGTVDDPNSFDENGGKTGPLGYYPVVNVSGQTIYVPSIARLKLLALGGANAEVLEVLIAQVSGASAMIEQVNAVKNATEQERIATAGVREQAEAVVAGAGAIIENVPRSEAAADRSEAAAATVADIIVRTAGVLIGGLEAKFSLGAYDQDGGWRSYLAVMPDGSIRSSAIGDLILSRLAGVQLFSTNIVGFRHAFVQVGADGVERVQFGQRDDGTWFSYGGGEAPIAKAMLIHVLGWGQSNMVGEEAKPLISTADGGTGSFRFARGSNTYIASDNAATPALRPASGFDLVPYTATLFEDRGGGFTDHMKATLAGFSRYSHVDRAQGDHVLFSVAARGGTYLTEIGPENTTSEGVASRPAGYPGVWATLLDDVVRGQAAAVAAGYVYSLPCWIVDQGESEGASLRLYRDETALRPRSEVRAGYLSRARTMIEAFDAHVRAVTGKNAPTPALISPPSNTTYLPSAWLDLCDASDLAIMVGPRYVQPSAKMSTPVGSRTHYLPDGQRWAGEMNAKVAKRVIVDGEDWQPCRALRAVKIDPRTVDVVFNVPRGPLVIDTTTFPKIRGWGFRTYAGSPDALPRTPLYHAFPTGVEVRGDTIRLTFPSDLPAGALIEIGGGDGHAAGQNGHVEGQSYDGFVDLPILSVGSTMFAGAPAFTLEIAGNRVATVQRMLALDVVIPFAGVKSGVIRAAQLAGGNTLLIGPTAELTGAAFVAGDQISLDRAHMGTNVRDSDTASSIHTFTAALPAWSGKPYPLWNWCCQYDNLPIEGA